MLRVEKVLNILSEVKNAFFMSQSLTVGLGTAHIKFQNLKIMISEFSRAFLF